jgi:uncharacterized protein YabN with tetrapyrrole methylase and pyrophosphatase domain
VFPILYSSVCLNLRVHYILFTVVNLARFLKVDPEQALRRTNMRFRKRFAHVEREMRAVSVEVSLERMEELWQKAKRLEE